MSTIPKLHMPEGTMYQQAAAWELIIASIILFGMIVYRLKNNGMPSMSGMSLKSGDYWMGEKSAGHFFIYFVLFVLVFSSAMFFFTKDETA